MKLRLEKKTECKGNDIIEPVLSFLFPLKLGSGPVRKRKHHEWKERIFSSIDRDYFFYLLSSL